MNNKDENSDRKTKDLLSISQTIQPLIKKIVGKNGFVETDIITNWSAIIGDSFAQCCFPQRIDFPKNKKNNGTLHLNVLSGAFALEIKHREKYILDKINTYFGYNAVSSLKIIQNNDFSIKSADNKTMLSTAQKKLSAKDSEKIKNKCNDIKNENLKEILIKLGHSIYANSSKTEKKKDED